MARTDVRIGNGAICEFLFVHTKHDLVYYDLLIFSNFSFFLNLLHRLVCGLGTPEWPDDTAHSRTNDLVLIVGSAARKRSPFCQC